MGCQNSGSLEVNLDIATSKELQAYLDISPEQISSQLFGTTAHAHIGKLLQTYAESRLSGKPTDNIYNKLPEWAAW